MFLFTTPTASASPPAAPAPVLDAIRQGANATGTSFDYLVRTAKRESALEPSAKAPTSSATGLFQFIEQTWLGILKSDGERLGLAEQANAISTRADGTFTVADPIARRNILELRKDPHLASLMAGALTRHNRDALLAAIGREPSAGELYIAHVLGPRGASELIAAALSQPKRPAASDFPDAAGANRAIFYHGDGRARGAADVYAVLAAAHAGSENPVSSTAPTLSAASNGGRPPGLYGIFQTGARSGPLSEAVARIWRANSASGAAAAAPPFFPRSQPRPANDSGSTASLDEDARPEAGGESGARSPEALPGEAAAAVHTTVLPPPRPGFEGRASAAGTDPARPLSLKVFARARQS